MRAVTTGSPVDSSVHFVSEQMKVIVRPFDSF
jgi:hypothetical protein